MVEVRACVYLSVLFLCFHVAIGKPMFGLFWCDIVCEEDDPATTTTASDAWDEILCGGCFPNRPTTTTPLPPAVTAANAAAPMAPGGNPPFNLMIPPSNGMNLTMWQPNSNNGAWWLNFVPWGPSGSPGGPPPGVTGPPAATAAPAAPAATTPAPAAAATTAAPAATTVAATTAAPAGK